MLLILERGFRTDKYRHVNNAPLPGGLSNSRYEICSLVKLVVANKQELDYIAILNRMTKLDNVGIN